MPTAFDMFKDAFFAKASRDERRELLNKTLYAKYILETVRSDYPDSYKSKMLEAIISMESAKEKPDTSVIAFANKHLSPLVDRMILKGGSTETAISFSDAELDIIERALTKELKQK